MSAFPPQDPGELPPEEASSPKWPLIAGVIGALLLAAVGGWWLMKPAKPAEPIPVQRESTDAAPAPPAPADVPAPATPAPERAAPKRDRAPREKAAAPVPEPAPVAVVGPTLVVDSDVPGASVFYNRKYLGTTPLKTTDVMAGSGQLNVSAEGHDGVVRNVDIAESGVTEVTVRLKEVRLDASVPVVHKHAMGSCEGTLRASVSGIRYETSNKGDAFTVPMAAVETFTIDYLQKTLKLKQRGGKTWNFTTKDATADPLFVFHRDVDKARTRLASQ